MPISRPWLKIHLELQTCILEQSLIPGYTVEALTSFRHCKRVRLLDPCCSVFLLNLSPGVPKVRGCKRRGYQKCCVQDDLFVYTYFLVALLPLIAGDIYTVVQVSSYQEITNTRLRHGQMRMTTGAARTGACREQCLHLPRSTPARTDGLKPAPVLIVLRWVQS